MVIKRVCEWCGKEFAAKTVRTRFCSDRCSKTAYKHNKRLEFVSNFNLEASIRKKPDDGTAERYSLSLAGVYKILQENKVLSCKLRGKTYYSLSHVTRLFTFYLRRSLYKVFSSLMKKYGGSLSYQSSTASVMVNLAPTARSSPVMAGIGSDQTENIFSPPVKVISTFNVIVMISGYKHDCLHHRQRQNMPTV